MADLTSTFKSQPLRDRTIQACIDYIEIAVETNSSEAKKGKFTDFFDIQGGTQPPKSFFIYEEKVGYVRFLQIRDFSSDATPTFIPIAKSNKTCTDEDILLGRYGASVGKILTGKSGAYNVACAKVVIEPDVTVSKDYLFYLLHSSRFQNAIRSISRSAQGGFNKTDLSRIEVSIPSLKQQKSVIEVLRHIDMHLTTAASLELDAFRKDSFSNLLIDSITKPLSIIADVEAANAELDRQADYLTQLRQALLREAMQGRLLPQDPTDEPAAALLQQLQAYKAATGKAGKRPAAPLFAQEAEAVEGTFEIPASWVWCELGDLAVFSEGGSSLKCGDRPATTTEWGILKMSAISSGTFFEHENKFYSAEAPSNIGAKIEVGDFIITRASGSADLVAKSVVVQEVKGNVLLNDKTIRYKFSEKVDVDFINLYNGSSFARAYFTAVNSATSTTMKNVTRKQIDGLPTPLPPLAEQQRLVAKLGQLLGHCDALEQRIQESRRLAGQLLQTALREALAGEP